MNLLTVQEVAAILKLSVLTIYKYIKERQLEAVEFGGHYRVSQASLDYFIKSHLVSNSSTTANFPEPEDSENTSFMTSKEEEQGGSK